MVSASPGPKRYAPRLPPEERRTQLLDAALAIAVERGFHAVTIDGVARACGVTRPVVYGLYDDRTALLEDLSERSEQRALAQLAEVFPAPPADGEDLGDPVELLVAGIGAYLATVRADPMTWRVILLPPEGVPEEMRERVRRHRAGQFALLRGLVDHGLARLGRPGLDTELFARSVFTLAEGAARLLLVDPDGWPLERFTDFTRDLLSTLH